MLPPPLKHRSTQKDIAKALGVSQATVAIALNSKTQWKLTPEMVLQVQAKAQELNYTPQRQASILRSGRSHIIGVVFLSGIFHAPQERVRLLARAAIRAGYQLVAVDIEWFDRDLKAVANYLVGAAAEGVVLCNLPWDLVNEWHSVSNVEPALNMSAGILGVGDNVYADLNSAFQQMTRHHLELGSRRLNLLLPFHEFPLRQPVQLGTPVQLRLDGFKHAIKEAGGNVFSDDPETAEILGIPYNKNSLSEKGVVGNVTYFRKPKGVNNALELGAWGMRRLLTRGSLPDSLICSNDDIAAGALQVCQREEVKVPEELRVSGADNAPFSAFCGTPITTISHVGEEMTNYAIERIVSLIEDPKLRSQPVTKAFSCSLLPRASTLGYQTPISGRKRSASQVGGFSLIELLVVIAIVSILCLLAVSGVQSIQKKGDDTRCIANLRASGMAVLAYLNDHDGRFLPKKYWFQYSSYRAGTTNKGMREYFGVEADSDINLTRHHIDTMLTCPTMVKRYRALKNSAFRRGYGINYFLFTTTEGPGTEISGFKKMQALPNLSAMWAMTDGAVSGGAANPDAGGLLGSVNDNTAYHQGNFMAYPHSGERNNFFFLDGRVEALTKGDLQRFRNSREFWGNAALTE